MLTKNPRIDKVIAWDLSPALLGEVLPSMVGLVGGDLEKIERVCGRFTPLMLDDHSTDLVVMSSAFHHELDPDALLQELVRVVRPRGPSFS
jgi:ubiquinone/menaquinone biosynthesis C-methylase UbiE